MSRYKFAVILFFIYWLTILSLQSLSIINFGTVVIPKSWVFYLFVLAVTVCLLDYLGLIKKSWSSFILTYMLIYNFIFNLVFAFDLYKVSPLINRVEHFFGIFLVSFVVYSLLSKRKFYTDIPHVGIKLIIMFFIIMTLGDANEIFELLMDLLFKTKNVGPNLLDTNWDILTNLVGAGTFLLAGRIFNFI